MIIADIVLMNQEILKEGWYCQRKYLNSLQIRKNELKEKINNNLAQQTATTTSSASTSETFTGREGFNIVDRESNMLKGKSSKTIPVYSNTRVQSDNIEPSDKSSFSGSYASV